MSGGIADRGSRITDLSSLGRKSNAERGGINITAKQLGVEDQLGEREEVEEQESTNSYDPAEKQQEKVEKRKEPVKYEKPKQVSTNKPGGDKKESPFKNQHKQQHIKNDKKQGGSNMSNKYQLGAPLMEADKIGQLNIISFNTILVAASTIIKKTLGIAGYEGGRIIVNKQQKVKFIVGFNVTKCDLIESNRTGTEFAKNSALPEELRRSRSKIYNNYDALLDKLHGTVLYDDEYLKYDFNPADNVVTFELDPVLIIKTALGLGEDDMIEINNVQVTNLKGKGGQVSGTVRYFTIEAAQLEELAVRYNINLGGNNHKGRRNGGGFSGSTETL